MPPAVQLAESLLLLMLHSLSCDWRLLMLPKLLLSVLMASSFGPHTSSGACVHIASPKSASLLVPL